MDFLQHIRRAAFWLNDKRKGGVIRTYLQDVSSVLSLENHALMEETQKSKLFHLLEHAAASSAFYRDYKNKSISEFPVINKNIIRDNFDAFRSSKFQKNELKTVVTSGSTGTPFRGFTRP